MRKRQLHVSGMLELFKCGVRYDKRHNQRIYSGSSPSAMIGTAVDHSAMEDLSNSKATGSLLPADEVQDIAREALVREWDRNEVRLMGEDVEEGFTASKSDAIDASIDLAQFVHRQISPGLRPTRLQREWTLDIAGIDDLQLAGAIDIQEANAIHDLKTTGKSPTENVAHSSLQLSMYALAVRQLDDGKIPDLLQLDYAVRTPKQHKMKYVPRPTTRTDEDMRPLVRRIQAANEIIKSGNFTPADPSSWWCSEKWCAYWHRCEYAMRPTPVAVDGSAVR